MLLDPEIAQQPIRHAQHRCAIDGVVRIERQRDVVDGLLYPIGLRRGRPHQQARGLRVVCRQVARLDPRNATG
jgi:hypothetical protein